MVVEDHGLDEQALPGALDGRQVAPGGRLLALAAGGAVVGTPVQDAVAAEPGAPPERTRTCSSEDRGNSRLLIRVASDVRSRSCASLNFKLS